MDDDRYWPLLQFPYWPQINSTFSLYWLTDLSMTNQVHNMWTNTTGVSDCIAPVSFPKYLFLDLIYQRAFRCMGAFGQYVAGKVLVCTLQGVSIGPLDTEHLLPLDGYNLSSHL